jgi:hypothetical protein
LDDSKSAPVSLKEKIKQKPSLAVEPVVQGSGESRVAFDKKVLRAERFNLSSQTEDGKEATSPAVASLNSVKLISADATKLRVVTAASTSLASTKCKYWPRCKMGASCVYYHPPVPVVKPHPPPVHLSTFVDGGGAGACMNFPRCPFGDACKFGHPPCKFGDACANPACAYSHVIRATAKPCYYGPACRNPTCHFLHPGF